MIGLRPVIFMVKEVPQKGKLQSPLLWIQKVIGKILIDQDWLIKKVISESLMSQHMMREYKFSLLFPTYKHS